MTRTDRRTLVRQLADQGLSQRAIGKRLRVSKDTVRRDLGRVAGEDDTGGAPPGEPESPGAPQASDGDGEEDAPQGEPVARLPRRVAQPLAGVDLSQWPAVRRDLAVLAQTGSSAESLVHQAVVAMAFAYRQALARGDIEPGRPFLVGDMRLRPLPHRAARTTPAPARGV